jgi:4-hydroxy-3-methylbut-2-enyl diphosphate reductase
MPGRLEVEELARSGVQHPDRDRAIGSQAPAPELDQLRRSGEYRDPCGLHLRLARTFGFCLGVKHAVAKALETADQLRTGAAPSAETGSSEPRLFMMGEIIHNPSTNDRLRRAGVEILPPPETPRRLSVIRATDWVIVPAFGMTSQEEAELKRIGCRVTDTTCGWVRRIWEAVRGFSRDGLTTVIHGKVEHEETRATASRTSGPYLIVRNREEAKLLARAIKREDIAADLADGTIPSWPQWFRGVFAGRCSPGFDPERDLNYLGLVNQTTMLASETEAIAAILTRAVAARSACLPPEEGFRTLDTFCPATQARQDAVRELLSTGKLDAMIVIGGFRSSNTAHLAALGAERVPTYHIEGPDCLPGADEIRYLPPSASDPVTTRAWRPALPCTLGITAGASTPQAEIDKTLQRLLAFYRREEP